MANPASGLFQCPQCARKYRWKPELAGKRVACKCGEKITVPMLDAPEVPASVASAAVASPAAPLSPPVVAAPPPLPALMVETLEYARPGISHPGRPGIFIAIGIISILIACISVLASGFTAQIWWRAYAGSVPPPSPSPAPLGLPGFGPYPGWVLGSHGMPAAARAPLVAGLPVTGPFAADRRAVFDRLLAEDGLALFGSPNAMPPALSLVQPSPPSQEIFFDLPNRGRLSLGINSAKCSGRVIDQLNGDVMSGPGRGIESEHWTALAIERRIEQLHKAMPAISSMQLGFVADELGRHYNPRRNWSTGEPALLEQIPVSHAWIGPGGVLSVEVNNTGFWIMPDGRGIDKYREPLGLDPATGTPLTQHKVGFTPQLPGDYHLMLALAIYCMAVILLALFLAVAGVRTLVTPASGVRLHCWFILLKPLFLATEVGLSLAFFDSVGASGQGSRIRFNATLATNGVISTSVVQMIYPIALLITFLSAQNMRRYVAEQGGSVGLFSFAALTAFGKRFNELILRFPVRLTLGALAVVGMGLAGLHGWSIYKSPQAIPPTENIVPLLLLLVVSLVFAKLSLRRSIGGGR